MQRIVRHIALAFLLCLTLSSCFRRPLHELDTSVYVDINIETDIVNYEVKQLPSLMRVIFYNHDNGSMVSQNFVGPEGGLVNVLPGRTYDVVCYNFDTEVTFVENENKFSSSYATTNLIPEIYRKKLHTRATTRPASLQKQDADAEKTDTKGPVEEFAFDPDHLFVGRAFDVYVPARAYDQEPIVIGLEAETVVESWIVELDHINGSQYIGAVSCVMTGLASGNFIGPNARDEKERSVYFESGNISEEGVLKARFNTFGMHPDKAGRQVVSFVFTDTAGKAYILNKDVSDQFIDNPKQYIRIVTEFEIPKPEPTTGGGITPDVDEWEDIVTDIEI